MSRYWKKRAFEKLGGYACQCCEEDRREFLTIDHLQGGGQAHRKQFSGQAGFYKWIALSTDDLNALLQILCMNCNWGKRLGKPCPHTLDTQSEYNRETEAVLEEQVRDLEAQRARLKSEIARLERVKQEQISAIPEVVPPGYVYVRQVARLSGKEFVAPANPLAATS